MLRRLLMRLAHGLGNPTLLMTLLMVLGLVGTWRLLDSTIAQSDRGYLQLTGKLLERNLLKQRNTLGHNLTEYNAWDDMYHAVSGPSLNIAWLRTNLTGSIYRTLDIQLSVITDAQGKPLYAVRNGAIEETPNLTLPFSARQWQHLVQMAARFEPLGNEGYPTAFFRDTVPNPLTHQTEPRLLMLALQRIVPETTEPDAALPARYLLFAKDIGPAQLEDIAGDLRLEQLQVDFTAAAKPPGALAVQGPEGQTLAYLTWQQELPGSHLQTALLPRALLLLLVLVAIALLLLRVSRQLTLHHQRTTARLISQGQVLRELVAEREDKSDPLDAYLKLLCQKLAATLDVSRVSVWRYQPDLQELECLIGIDRDADHHFAGALLHFSAHPDYFSALHRERYLSASNATSDPRLASMRDYLLEHTICSMLDAAVTLAGTHYGVICVEDRNKREAWHPDEINFVCSSADVVALMMESGARLQAEGELHRHAYYDRFTGLPNRARLLMQLDELAQNRSENPVFGCLILALDALPNLNELYGHDTGDQVILLLCERLARLAEPGELVARVAENRFCLILLGKDESNINRRVTAINETLNLPLDVNAQLIGVRVSAGLALSPQDSKEPLRLLEHAELAMQISRNSIQGGWVRFHEDMSTDWHRRHLLINELRQAIGTHQLFLCYQPYHDLKTRRTRGAEALLRWHHPEHGFISPGEFIPLAEDSGVIVPLGEWALREACQQTAKWRQGGQPEFTISVNVSLLQLEDPHFADLVAGILATAHLPPSALELEVTETLALRQSGSIEDNIRRLKALGVSLAIDDFGTGYASFSYLRRFPAEKIKIDKQFLDQVPDNHQDAAIVRMIVAMGHSLGAMITGEGIENERQLAFLAEIGCDYAQGFHLSKPLEQHAMSRYLSHNAVAASNGQQTPTTL
ncbi:bifunctional diguanylate cyclase/phosphodiesterase [Pseudogulbenkiania subflava]|uniref:Diguanylate cyclase (GGDEF) domain-containing protein n=1 Tax=Pseudogulbenkiania subflava DSM 22618 TaxID=1123014 RepID=A0A1Y6BA02_9NEIS|nr:EAL domain-containing protein [Pseudogulbenkiania subflava]SME93494.1 diguanylate cyclase (GGDEF) domain-containing protein [Pseudogulbenkiania subflava DSM 22618]